MAWVDKRVTKAGKTMWQTHYRGPDGKIRSAGRFAHKSKALASANAAELESKKRGWRDPSLGAIPYGEWIEQWWPTRPVSAGTLKSEGYIRERYLLPKWGTIPLSEINRQDVRAWAAELLRGTPDRDAPDAWLRRPLSPASVARYLGVFSTSLSAAVDDQLINENPAWRVKVLRGEVDARRFLTREEVQALLAAMRTTHDWAVVSLLVGTGARWGEAMGLQIESVDLERKRIRLSDTWVSKMHQMKPYPKGRRIRYVPLPEWLAPILVWAIAGRKEGFVLGPPPDLDNWRKRAWSPGAEAAGLRGIRIHDLRHTYASHRLQDGATLAEVGQLLGHIDQKTTQRYAHLEEEFSDRVRMSVGVDDAWWAATGQSRLAGQGATEK